MDSAVSLAEIESIAAEECSYIEWHKEANFVLVDLKCKIVWKQCKGRKHSLSTTIKYHSPKELFALTHQVVALITNISDEWTLLKYDNEEK